MIRWAIVALTASLSAAHAADLALRQIMLSSGGVAYVEYAAEVNGPATLGLDVPLEQVDDVLTSLVVFDSAGGVGGIELPGRDNTATAFGDVPFGPEALASPLDFLNSLQGVMLEVRGPRPMTGRLLRAERVREPARNDAGAERTRVTLIAADGLRQFVLEEAEAVEVADPALRARIDSALEALRRDASRSVRHLALRGSGAGARTIRVGYVAAAALWKASYRLVLPPADGQKARLQGWAVLENSTGADWNGVRLTLQYGNPVTFHQAIYRSYFVQRPEVPVEVLGRLLPDVDTRATPMAAPALQGGVAGKTAMRALGGAAGGPPPAMAAPAEAAETTEGAEETIFAIPAPVTLAAGHTASVPILDREVTARRVGLVQMNRPHPLAAVQLANDTGSSLPAGVLTLYDPAASAAFAGDARLGGLPAGESRLLSFAEDLRTAVTWRTEDGSTLAAVTAANGVLQIDRRLRWTLRIGLAAPTAEPRNLLVEVPKRPGTTLVTEDAPAPSEETATAWRLAVTLAAGEARTLVLHEDRIVREQTVLMQDDRGVVASLLGTQSLTPAARAALQHLAELRADAAARAAERDRLLAQRDEVEHAEERTRQNLAAVPVNDALHDRLVRQLEASEGRIEALGKSIEQASAAVDQAHAALAAAVAALRI